MPVEVVIRADGVDVRLLDNSNTHVASAFVECHGNKIRLVVSDEEANDDVAGVIVLVGDVARALVRPAGPG